MMGQKYSEGRFDSSDTAGVQPSEGASQSPNPEKQTKQQGHVIEANDITEEEFDSSVYPKCHEQKGKVGKAVIVSNFMEDRKYAAKDCEELERVLKKIGFESVRADGQMVFQNLSKEQLLNLSLEVATQTDYRKNQGFTCVLFIILSYGQQGVISCHNANGEKDHLELKVLQEHFQPQNNKSLALKPKIFIIQTVPPPQSMKDSGSDTKEHKTKRIPREADFLTYTSDSYCIVNDEENAFVNAVVKTLENLTKDGSNSHLEIQMVLIAINRKYKELRGSHSDWDIPCTISSLTKQLYLF